MGIGLSRIGIDHRLPLGIDQGRLLLPTDNAHRPIETKRKLLTEVARRLHTGRNRWFAKMSLGLSRRYKQDLWRGTALTPREEQ